MLKSTLRPKSRSGLHFSSVRLTGWTGRPQGNMPGWDGTPVDVWRLMSAGTWWDALIQRPNQAMLDWLGPFLNLRAIAVAHASGNRLWLHEVTVDEVPREWLRWAVMLLQGVRKVTPGTPADNQIAMYTYLADHFV